MIDIGVGVVVGALAGRYFGIVILILLMILTLLGTAIIDMANGLFLQITLFHMACIWLSLQLAYFGSAFVVSRSRRQSAECENAPKNMYAADQNTLCEGTPLQVHRSMGVTGPQARQLYRHLELK